MIEPSIIKQIEDFVYAKPRSIQEIAEYIQKNWRTADRYVEKIKQDYGTIDTRNFREGTRGALKIVYWSAIDKVSNSVFQEQLEQDIFKGKTKYDLSPFDIFQHIEGNKKANVEEATNEELTNIEELALILKQTQNTLYCFSGNLSFINLKNHNINIFNILEDLVKKEVKIKVICRVDLAGIENIKKLLSLNYKYGKEFVEIRHREQPLRAMVIDNKILRIKEIKEPTGRFHELNKKTFIFYTITNKDWIKWITRIFWKMFSTSINSGKRLKEMEKVGN